ncbi:ABC transporter ATP-binding protein [Limosilactobacillus coleohominis]|uniref:ATP-binding cassette domain-containing protein n=1 Tax=Limosilactobacillus coleohominis TaxID=181675 RepID=A0ABS2GXR9_9LACO|nr:ABC transporter transmembrane domain-containing protein [Limosilactobacillus coleohominis]MBM6939943.1 ATP-binding cassette domain-containing protein [Limosilactobacillus coleohominis]MBM6954300.1 ATP-binding cassette domain-containing protein [Limosilactobacillus coleohominis]HJA22625.1 ATP-binding cassette domain-containing protein [Candidatus Limosilactobacillus intestinavium]
MRIFRQLNWFFKEQWREYLGGVIALILVAICNVIPARVIGNVVDAISDHRVTSGWLAFWVGVMLIAAAAQYLLRFAWQRLIYGSSYVLERQLRGQLFAHYLNMDPTFYQKWRTGDLMAHATNDVEAVREVASYGILTLADSIITGGSMIIAMGMFVSWRLTLLTLIPLPLLVVLANRLGNKIHESYGKAQASFGDLNNKTQESVSGMRVLKSLGQEKADQEDFNRYVKRTFDANRRAYFWDALFNPATTLIMGLSYIIAIGVGGWMVIKQQLRVGQLVTMMTYLGELVWPLFAIGTLFNTLERGRASYDRISHLLNEKNHWQKPQSHLQISVPANLTVDVDQFGYEDSVEPVLHDIHFKVKPGEMVGIVGPTGGGKSTLMRLLIRDFDRYTGSIKLGKHDIREIAHDRYLANISYVPQTSFLFSTNIQDNLRFQDINAPLTQVQKSAQEAAIDKDIQQMPDQYETEVGQQGVSLSGGQQQRIAIGRALMKATPFLILDDPLSAVDAQTATTIEQNLRHHRDQSVIMVTSRLSTVQNADWVIVLNHGTIVQQGTPGELSQQPGWYQETLQLQKRHQQLEEDLNE